ncbi:hypothetical protein B0H11DRAFT_2191300 [Mycena galericulata]|nr:hypothetical protein B0H11DRAFT_2191300 [Mycena galericulata]
MGNFEFARARNLKIARGGTCRAEHDVRTKHIDGIKLLNSRAETPKKANLRGGVKCLRGGNKSASGPPYKLAFFGVPAREFGSLITSICFARTACSEVSTAAGAKSYKAELEAARLCRVGQEVLSFFRGVPGTKVMELREVLGCRSKFQLWSNMQIIPFRVVTRSRDLKSNKSHNTQQPSNGHSSASNPLDLSRGNTKREGQGEQKRSPEQQSEQRK